MKRKLSVIAVSFLSISMALGQNITLEDLYVKRIFSGKRVPERVWTKDGGHFTLVSEKGLLKVSASDFDTTLMVSADALVPQGSDKVLDVQGCEWSGDGKYLVIYTNSARVWRANTRGDYWILDVAAGKLKQLGSGLNPSEMMFGKLSPDATQFAFVYHNDIYVENIVSGERRRLTFDGGDSIINGTFDWVYEEELDDRDGFRWSPDGERIVYWHSDTGGTGVFYMINN
ncbi:MAG: DPP IV N-terminal domain-containing protein, partial [Alistipes sp.]|nr:DPP IV N-terminal domain-containing protein [Candidatus Minthomonas equi]